MIRRHRADTIAVAVLLALAALLIYKWSDEVVWTSDSLFYEARSQEFRGQSRSEALTGVWNGPHADLFRSDDAYLAEEDQALRDPRWIPYSARFFRRRLLVPLAAAIGYPLWHHNGLIVVSMAGLVALTLVLYALLRMRFSVAASTLAVAVCLAWPPLRWAFLPLTDSWGIALETLALLLAVLVVERGERFLAAWALTILALSFTRDLTLVVLVSAVALMLLYRSRRTVALVATGVVAALPAPLLFGAPLREQLAYLLNGNRIPLDASWSFVSERYDDAVRTMLDQDWTYLGQIDPRFADTHGLPLMPVLSVLFGLGIVLLLVFRPAHGTDAMFTAVRASLLGVVLYLLTVASFSFMRLELAFLPAAAMGLALWADLLLDRPPATTAPAPAAGAAQGRHPPSA